MSIVRNAELVWDGEQQRVCRRDRLVFPKLFDQNIRFRCVATAENCSSGFVKIADLVLFLTSSSEIESITIVDQGKNTATDGNARGTDVASFLPGCTKGANLRGLLNAERLTGLIEFEGRGLQIHAELGGPNGCGIRSRPPPDTIAQSFSVRLKAQQPRRSGGERSDQQSHGAVTRTSR